MTYDELNLTLNLCLSSTPEATDQLRQWGSESRNKLAALALAKVDGQPWDEAHAATVVAACIAKMPPPAQRDTFADWMDEHGINYQRPSDMN